MKSEKIRERRPASRAWLRYDVTGPTVISLKDCLGLNALSDLQIVNIPQPDPVAFSCPESFRTAYWRAECLSKFENLDTGIDRKAAAVRSFYDAEAQCAQANSRLCDLWGKPIPERYRATLRRAQALLAYLFDGFSVSEVFEHSKWGPGASTSMRRAQASHQNKWVLATHMTPLVRPYFDTFCKASGWVFSAPTVVPGNRVQTVPKNAKTDRLIAIEPDWNSFFQLGMGGAIRTRLQRRFGVLRKTAQEVNQRLAKAGSEDGFLATIDLKGASDTVSLALGEALLPPDVFTHLFNLRSPNGFIEGKWVPYEKISSMGNGSTFELETAVFYCISRAACGHASVYGDDIVVPSGSVSFLIDLLGFCGFTVNDKKSHFGPTRFRESCGGHFFAGVNVTPPYIRKPLRGSTRIAFCNTVRRCSDNGHWCDGLLYAAWKECSRGIPRYLYGPSGVNEALTMSFAESIPQRSMRYQSYTGTTCYAGYKQPKLAHPVGGLRQALFGAPGFLEYQKPPGVPVDLFGRWIGAWRDPSPWAAE